MQTLLILLINLGIYSYSLACESFLVNTTFNKHGPGVHILDKSQYLDKSIFESIAKRAHSIDDDYYAVIKSGESFFQELDKFVEHKIDISSLKRHSEEITNYINTNIGDVEGFRYIPFQQGILYKAYDELDVHIDGGNLIALTTLKGDGTLYTTKPFKSDDKYFAMNAGQVPTFKTLIMRGRDRWGDQYATWHSPPVSNKERLVFFTVYIRLD